MPDVVVPEAFSSDEVLSDLYEDGHRRGWNAASWIDIPERGTSLPKDIDNLPIGVIEDADQDREAMAVLAHAAESNDRQFSPFEAKASRINELDNSDTAWRAFEEGISDGISAQIASRSAAIEGMYPPDGEPAL